MWIQVEKQSGCGVTLGHLSKAGARVLFEIERLSVRSAWKAGGW